MSFVDRWMVGLALAVALGSAALGSAALAQSPGAPDTGAPNLGAERAAIAALRRANNQAIAARDLDAMMGMMADDYVLVAGSDGVVRSKADMGKLWAKDFAAAAPANQCVRQPATIEVGLDAGVLRAAETGRWRCPRRTPSGAAAPYGAYFAHWSKRAGAWRVVSDNYVTLGCRGPGC